MDETKQELSELMKAAEEFDPLDRIVARRSSWMMNFALIAGMRLGTCNDKACIKLHCAINVDACSDESMFVIQRVGRVLALESIHGALRQLDTEHRKALLLTKTDRESLVAMAMNHKGLMSSVTKDIEKLKAEINESIEGEFE